MSIYLKTLLPGIDGWGDTVKWQFLGSVLGIPHPTGYPLYLIITNIISHIPVFSLAYKINAFSAFCMATATAGLFVLLRQLNLPEIFSALAASCFAFSNIVWSQAVVAEVYGLNMALAAWTMVLFILWHKTQRLKFFLFACLLYSLSFGNHLTVICLLPAIVFLTLTGNYKTLINPRTIGSILLIILLGISLYFYLYWRTFSKGVHLEYKIYNFIDFIDYISGERYRRYMFSLTFDLFITQKIPAFFQIIWNEYHFFSFFGILGLITFTPRKQGLFFLLIFLAYGIFVTNYTIHDIIVYYIPILFISIIFIAKGIWILFLFISEKKSTLYILNRLPGNRVWISIMGHLLMLIAAFIIFTTNYKKNDMSKNNYFEKEIQLMINRIDSNAVIMLDGWGKDYGIFEGLMYYLYGENFVKKNIWIVAKNSTKDASNYLAGTGELYSNVMDQRVPSGLNFFVINHSLAEAISSDQTQIIQKKSNLYKIQPPDSNFISTVIYLDATLENIISYQTSKPVMQKMIDSWRNSTFWHGDNQIYQRSIYSDKIELNIDVPKSGNYLMKVNLTHAPDYGKVTIFFDGQAQTKQLDLYSSEVKSEIHVFFIRFLHSGSHLLEFRTIKRDVRHPNYCFGFDFIKLFLIS